MAVNCLVSFFSQGHLCLQGSGPSNLRELVVLPRELTALERALALVNADCSDSRSRSNSAMRFSDLTMNSRHSSTSTSRGGSLASFVCLLQLRLQTLGSHSGCVPHYRESLLDFHHLQTSGAIRTHAGILYGLCHGPIRPTENLDPTRHGFLRGMEKCRCKVKLNCHAGATRQPHSCAQEFLFSEGFRFDGILRSFDVTQGLTDGSSTRRDSCREPGSCFASCQS